MLKVIVLVCAGTLPHGSCTPENAISVTHGPPVGNLMTCGFSPQGLMASTQLLREGDYIKIICEPSDKGKKAADAQ